METSGHGIVATRLEDCLVVTVGEELDGDVLVVVRQRTLGELQAQRCRAVIFELSALTILDRSEFRELRAIGEMVRVLGAVPVLVGLRPGLVQYLVETDVDVTGVRAFLTLEQGLAGLRVEGGGSPWSRA
jgi:anti-anti-sigma regulatory factor